MATLDFDAAAVDTSSHDIIPNGIYEAVVSASEIKPNKAGTGKGLNLTFDILSDPARGRKVWTWINIQHARPEAQRIGQEELARLCRAVGITRLTDSEQLHNIPLLITVGVDRNDPTRNTVVRFSAKPASSSATPAPAPSASSAAPASGAAPWAR